MKVVVAACTVALALAGCNTSAAPPSPTTSLRVTTTIATTTTTTPTTVTTTATTAPLPEPLAGSGRQAVDPAVFGDVTLTAGAAAGGRLVLAGCHRPETESRELPLWWSDDGERWQRAEGPPDAACFVQVEASTFGFYADPFGGGDALHSPDGTAWNPVDPAPSLGQEPRSFGVPSAIFVAPGGDRVTLLYSRAAEAESRIATLATTTDGEAWELGPESSADLFDSSDVNAVIAAGPGLIAVGASPGGEFVPTAAAFTSPDGLTWSRTTPGGPDFDDKVMNDVMAVEDGFVAVGGDFFTTGLMTAWTSADGVAWTRAPHPPEETDPAVAFMTAEAVTAAGGRIWAAGRDSDARRGNEPPRPAVWASDRGAAWERVDVEDARGRVPFVVLDTPDLRLGTWPPPFSLETGPVQLFDNRP